MANVIRKDVVQIGFEINAFKDLTRLQNEINNLKKKLTGGIGDGAFDDMKNSANEAVKPLKNIKEQAEKVSKKLVEVGKTAATKAYNGLKKLAGISFKGLTIGIGAAVTAVGGLVAKSVSAYADYEQLVGGVETLFKDSSGIIQTYANDAYKTAGLSANDYMETVTGFSASLLQSLKGDTQKAAEYADMAVSDMADNANKMGTDMEMIQNAYQGFAKQNYTMLDNLKLGYGGTKEEMQRLVKDAAKIDKSVKANDMSFGNLVKAIHAVQVNMDIYGTTAKEAEGTISGSLASMKSAWKNMYVAISTGGDNFEQCLNNLISSAKIFGKNIIPAVRESLVGIGDLIEGIAPIIADEIPNLVNDLLPPLIKAAVSLVSGLIKALPSIISTLIKEIPNIATQLGKAFSDLFSNIMPDGEGSNLFSTIFGDIKNAISQIIPTIGNVIRKMGEFLSKKETLDAIKNAWDGIKTAVKAVWFVVEPIISLIANNLDTLIPIIMNVVKAFVAFKIAMIAVNFVMMASPITWIVIAIVALIAVIALCVKHWDKIKEAASNCWNKIKEAASNCWNKIKEMWGNLGEWFNTKVIQPIKNFFSGLWNWIKENARSIVLFIINPFAGIFSYLYDHCEGFRNKVNSVVQSIIGFFKSLWQSICNIGNWIYSKIIQPIVNFIKGAINVISVIVLGLIGLICQGFLKIANWINTNVIQPVIGFFMFLWNKIVEIVTSIWNGICTIWGAISSWVNSYVIQPVITFFVNLWNKITSIVKSVWNTICRIWSAISNWINSYVIQPVINLFVSLWKKIKYIISTVKETIISVWSTISGWVSSNVIEPIKGFFTGLWNKLKEISVGIRETLVNAFKTAWDKVTSVWNKLKDFFTGIWEGLKSTGGALKDTLVGIWKDAVSAIAKPVNKLIGGANWLLEKLGSSKRVAKWQPYAKGTNGHPGGNAIVNDGRGAELVQMPNGNTFLAKGRNVLMPNAPKGMKVLSAENTAQLFGKKKPTFHYEEGTGGGFDIWDFFDNAKGLVGKVIDKFVSFKGMAGYTLDVGKGMISTAKDAMSSWISNLLKEFGGKDIGSYVASAGVEQWKSTVIRALKMEGQYSPENVKRTLYQMQTESGGNPRAINLWDSNAKKGIPSKGLMQVIDPTFQAYARPGFNKNIYDPLSNILASIRYAVSRYGSLAKAYRGVGYSGGVGTVELPEQQKTVHVSYTPENSYTGGRATVTEHNTYAPVFNLTLSGSDDRTLERKVKRWIQESMNDVFDSMARRNPRLREV